MIEIFFKNLGKPIVKYINIHTALQATQLLKEMRKTPVRHWTIADRRGNDMACYYYVLCQHTVKMWVLLDLRSNQFSGFPVGVPLPHLSAEWISWSRFKVHAQLEETGLALSQRALRNCHTSMVNGLPHLGSLWTGNQWGKWNSFPTHPCLSWYITDNSEPISLFLILGPYMHNFALIYIGICQPFCWPFSSCRHDFMVSVEPHREGGAPLGNTPYWAPLLLVTTMLLLFSY